MHAWAGKPAKPLELSLPALTQPVLGHRHGSPLKLDPVVPTTPSPARMVAKAPPKPATLLPGLGRNRRVLVRPLFEDRKELHAELARELLKTRELEPPPSSPVVDDSLWQRSQDIFWDRVLHTPVAPRRENNELPRPALPETNAPIMEPRKLSTSESCRPPSPVRPPTATPKPEAPRVASLVPSPTPRLLNWSVDTSYMVFMVQEATLSSSPKRQNLALSEAAPPLRRPFQKTLLEATMTLPVLENAVNHGTREALVRISLLSTGAALVSAGNASLTLLPPPAFEPHAPFSPPWTQAVVTHLAFADPETLVLVDESPLEPLLAHALATSSADAPSHVVETLLLEKHQSIQLCVAPEHSTASWSVFLDHTDLQRIFLHSRQLHISMDEAKLLLDDVVWLRSLVTDMPFVHLLVQQAALEAAMRSTPSSVESTTLGIEPLRPNTVESSSPQHDRRVHVDIEPLSPQVQIVRALSQHLADVALQNTTLWLQKQEAAFLYANSYIKPAVPPRTRASARASIVPQALDAKVETLLASYQQTEIERLAILLWIDDLVLHFLHYECRVELHFAKVSGGYNDYLATRIQSVFRMARQRKQYTMHQRVRHSAAKLIQTLQRGVTARKRYIERKLERERYFYFGFRHYVHVDDPVATWEAQAALREHRRVAFLLTLLRDEMADVQSVLNQYGVVVGCPIDMGDRVVARLRDGVPSLPHVQTAIVAELRALGDDTYGHPRTRTSATPRHVLKSFPSLHKSNRVQLAREKEARRVAGMQAAHILAHEFRDMRRHEPLETQRAAWAADLNARYVDETRTAQLDVTELVAVGMAHLQDAVKVWGLDPNPIFDICNVCLVHRFGQAALQALEVEFNEFALGMNAAALHDEVHSLRDEIEEELPGFEKLLLLRCLNHGAGLLITPASDILHVLLHGPQTTAENIRVALPTVLPVATFLEKLQLGQRLLAEYADESYGHGLCLILASCLDAAGTATLEAGQFLDRFAKPALVDERDEDVRRASSPLAHALDLLTGTHLYRLLEFCAKVAPMNERLREIVRWHLVPYVHDVHPTRGMALESHRMCMVVLLLQDAAARRQVLSSHFAKSTLEACDAFWAMYAATFGASVAAAGRASMAK
ncbi:hypothetical protein SDRG_05628 [Saprolegnia diclina VS20]|uniref:Uncharacterized protein n=1 Tax=Saprolegnia diclina (strain VS20) TaxID=1156394 RepID=T0QS12_SAPDV|nr:hypothetical protein SDRG_05628 [Saprolegnia diclina VS20]EQC36795.1 hypothetical protein SDRG_05628 [Saprolegnia diclina VS20]|eukprot:XP_008609576.1 hypothetical protein SDRG_05628 [Saprolegnia diclina VS20]